MGENINAYKVLVGKPEREKPVGRAKLRWEDNIKMGVRSLVGWHELDLSGLGQGEVSGSCEHDNEPSVFIDVKKYFVLQELLVSQE
jgi:hypothetical protein